MRSKKKEVSGRLVADGTMSRVWGPTKGASAVLERVNVLVPAVPGVNQGSQRICSYPPKSQISRHWTLRAYSTKVAKLTCELGYQEFFLALFTSVNISWRRMCLSDRIKRNGGENLVESM